MVHLIVTGTEAVALLKTPKRDKLHREGGILKKGIRKATCSSQKKNADILTKWIDFKRDNYENDGVSRSEGEGKLEKEKREKI